MLYNILQQLGQGAFGETFLAEDCHLPDKDQCVVKQLKPQQTDPKTLKAAQYLFAREAKILNRLGKWDGIPRLLAHFEENQQFYLVQELIIGEDLSKEILPGRQWRENEVIELLLGILEVLVFVHENKIVHRDIKPSNLMRRKEDGKIILIDFGAVKQIASSTINLQNQTTTFTVAVGTPGYMPGEQAQGKPQLASDIYAVGIVAIQALTGLYPHLLPQDPQTGEIVWQDRVKVSDKLARILNKSIAYDYRQRYSSAGEALAAVKQLQSLGSWGSLGIKIGLGLIGFWLAVFLGVFLLRPTPRLVYQNLEYGLQIEYSKKWQLEEVGDTLGTIARFYLDKKRQVEVVITVEELTEEMSLGDYTTSAIAEITRFLQGAAILESQPITLARREAHRVVYSGEDPEGNLKLKFMQVWLLEDNRAYILTYSAEESQYENYLDRVEEIAMDSFSLVNHL